MQDQRMVKIRKRKNVIEFLGAFFTSVSYLFLFCSPLSKDEDNYNPVNFTSSVTMYKIYDTTILDSSKISFSEMQTFYLHICKSDTTDSSKYPDSICYPVDFLKMEYNDKRKSVNYLNRFYNLSLIRDTVVLNGNDFISGSPCANVDTSLTFYSKICLYGNLNNCKLSQLSVKDRHQNYRLFIFGDPGTAYKTISERKQEIARCNRITDSLRALGIISMIRPNYIALAIQDTCYFYFSDIHFQFTE